jgi:hypothetical protein
MNDETVKRGPGRPRKNPIMEREPQREAMDKPLKMRAKPNWETMDADGPETPDRLYISPDKIPEGMSAQWVTHSVFGQAVPTHRAEFERKGWTPVHQDDFDGQFNGKWMPKDAPGEIEVDGLVLMIRPKELTDRAQRANDFKARQEVAIKERALRGGDMPGVTLDPTHPSALGVNRIGKTRERIEVPQDDGDPV